jgi:hypothetical protein
VEGGLRESGDVSEPVRKIDAPEKGRDASKTAFQIEKRGKGSIKFSGCNGFLSARILQNTTNYYKLLYEEKGSEVLE